MTAIQAIEQIARLGIEYYKVVVIIEAVVITGSCTKDAEQNIAENLLVIRSSDLIEVTS